MSGDMTRGSAARCILRFMLPILLGSLLQQLYNTADSMIVGNFAAQPYALAAVGTCAPATMLLVSLAVGFCGGGSVVASQYFGAQQNDSVRRALSTLLIFSALLGVAVALGGALCSRWLLRTILCVEEAILPLAATYLRIYCVGLVFSFIYNGAAAALRALGNAHSSLLFLAISAVSNIVLDLLFVAVFGWGVAGAAVATVLAQLFSALASLVYLLRRYRDFLPRRGEVLFDAALLRQIVGMGLPNALQGVAIHACALMLQRLVNGFGAASMEAFLAANRLDSFLLAPTDAFSTALMNFTAQNIGAGNEKRARQGMFITHGMNGLLSLCLIVPITLLAPRLVGLFGVSEAALALGVKQVRWVLPFMVLFAVHVPGCSFIRGAGASGMATFCTLISMVIRLLCAYLFVGSMGYAGIYTFYPVGWACEFVVVWGYFFSGRWRGKALVKAAPRASER